MKNKKLFGLIGIAVLAAVVMSLFAVSAFAGVSPQEGAGDAAEDAAEGDDGPITGDALEQASAAALEFVGQGQVTGTETGDEESYYEIEITLDDGSMIDVQLDEEFNVLNQEFDGVDDSD